MSRFQLLENLIIRLAYTKGNYTQYPKYLIVLPDISC
jgi:hypothetical protein